MFESEVEILTRYFPLCYRLRVDGMAGRAEWELFALPEAGGVADQDARLMFGLAEVARIQNQIIVDEQREREAKKKKEAAQKNKLAKR